MTPGGWVASLTSLRRKRPIPEQARTITTLRADAGTPGAACSAAYAGAQTSGPPSATVVSVSHDMPTPWHDAVTCGVCDRRVPRLSSTMAADAGSSSSGICAYVTCPGCGIRYRWDDSAHWVPADPLGSPRQ